MRIKVWGARGSHPQPMRLDSFRTRVKSIVQKIRPIDIVSNESRELFLSSLPHQLWNIPGGNTPCIEVRVEKNDCFIFDAGTGIISLSQELLKQKEKLQTFHIFFSHFHYDHIQGLPFFSQAYFPDTMLHFYSPEKNIKTILQQHMSHPYFPVTMQEKMTAHQFFHVLEPNDEGQQLINLAGVQIHWKRINHPGKSYAYKITENQKKMIIATDYELERSDFMKTEENRNFFEGADLLILDTMYTLGQAIEKFNWGHSSFSMGVDFAQTWKNKRLLLFHHEPQHEDKHLYENLRTARWYSERQDYTNLRIDIAEEGMVIEL